MFTKYRFAAAVLAFGILEGIAFAQGASAQAENTAKNSANMSAEAQLTEGQAIVARGERLSTRVSGMLEGARKEADIIRITCLNEKLTQINANLRNAQKRLEAMTSAVNSDLRNHEYTVLTVLGQKLQTLDQESNQCIGQDIYETGATLVQTDIDPAIVPNEDPTKTLEIPPAVPPIPPTSASPIK